MAEHVEVIGVARPRHATPHLRQHRHHAVVGASARQLAEGAHEDGVDHVAVLRRSAGIPLVVARGDAVHRGEDRRRDRAPWAAERSCETARRRRGRLRAGALVRDAGAVLDAGLEEVHGLGRELDHRALIATDRIEVAAHLVARGGLERAEERVGRAIEEPELDAERAVEATDGDDERAGGRERRSAERQPDERERADRVEHPLAAHRREEARQRRAVVRRTHGGDAAQPREPREVLLRGGQPRRG